MTKKNRKKVSLPCSAAIRLCRRTRPLIKYLSEQGIKAGMLKTEEIYMEQNNKRMHEATDPLYFVIEEKLNSVDLDR